MGDELLPCPWCGASAEYRLDVWTHEVGCTNKSCAVRPTASLYRVVDKGAFGDGGTEAAVRAAWNKRHNVRSQATDAALSRQVACTDGLGVAVPPAPTFEQGEKA